MKKHEVHTLSAKSGFSSMKETLTKEVEHFLNKKTNEGYEVISVSFTYYQSMELIAFITLSK
uniref:hypothetical protein n=1 Tax=Flavobacterium sp. TaxID=239 RepID=UPI00404A5985